jgi:hypothetical protein
MYLNQVLGLKYDRSRCYCDHGLMKLCKKATYRHCNKGGNLIDVCKHGNLSNHEGDKYRIYRLVRLPVALAEERESRYEMIPSKCL